MTIDARGELAAQILAALSSDDYEVVVPPPGEGEGFWAGGPSTVLVDDVIWLAYRMRRPVDQGRGYANLVARSDDGVEFETVAGVTSDDFECASLERPALVPMDDGSLRMYVSCSTWHSKHWWVEAVDIVDGVPKGESHMVLPGDADTAWKDVVVDRDTDGWRMWACRHPLDGGDDEADRMTTWYATSADGLAWEFQGPALKPTAGTWDQRGTRIASVARVAGKWMAFYDGRASSDENWHERTGVALGDTPARFVASDGPTPAGHTARYLSVVELSDGYRLYWEGSRDDRAHDLRTAYVPRSVSVNQS